VTGRDTPYQEYTLRFRDCSWELVERKTQEQLAKETIPDVLFRLVDFMRDKEEWIGTATELLAAMGDRRWKLKPKMTDGGLEKVDSD
jgi:hypothetical protein